MNIPYAQTHFDSAGTLFRQRQGMLVRSACDVSALARLEQRLRLHLHVLGRCNRDWPEPQKAPDTFVRLAAGLSSPDRDIAQESRSQALARLGEGGPRREGAFAALSLFPPVLDSEQALTLYRRQEALRPLLFHLWREQGVPIPAALLNIAEAQGKEVRLRQAALEYAADRPEVGLEIFQAVYRPLVDLSCSSIPVPGVMAAALRGGLLRGDPEVPRALRRAIDLCRDGGTGSSLRYLAALSGAPDLYPVLRCYFAENPVDGAMLLALHGSTEAADDLLVALGQADVMHPAAAGWQQLTGISLSQRPRLQIAGKVQQGARQAETRPDSEAAHRWRNTNTLRTGDVRIFCGEPLRGESLLGLLHVHGGILRADLLDLFALQLGRPLGFSRQTWIEWQQRDLKKAASYFADACHPDCGRA